MYVERRSTYDAEEALESNESALVVGASGGIGAALAGRLAARGMTVHAFSRRPITGGVNMIEAQVDITDEASIAAACAGLDRGPPLRFAIVATGLLHDDRQQPEKSMRTLDAKQLARSFAINAIGPALVAKHVLPHLPRSGRSVFAVLSARVGSIADNRLGGWYGYRASKAALNQIVRTLSIETQRTRPDAIVVALHPGTVATRLSAPFRNGAAVDAIVSADAAADHLLRVVDALTPQANGGFVAWDGSPIPY